MRASGLALPASLAALLALLAGPAGLLGGVLAAHAATLNDTYGVFVKNVLCLVHIQVQYPQLLSYNMDAPGKYMRINVTFWFKCEKPVDLGNASSLRIRVQAEAALLPPNAAAGACQVIGPFYVTSQRYSYNYSYLYTTLGALFSGKTRLSIPLSTYMVYRQAAKAGYKHVYLYVRLDIIASRSASSIQSIYKDIAVTAIKPKYGDVCRAYYNDLFVIRNIILFPLSLSLEPAGHLTVLNPALLVVLHKGSEKRIPLYLRVEGAPVTLDDIRVYTLGQPAVSIKLLNSTPRGARLQSGKYTLYLLVRGEEVGGNLIRVDVLWHSLVFHGISHVYFLVYVVPANRTLEELRKSLEELKNRLESDEAYLNRVANGLQYVRGGVERLVSDVIPRLSKSLEGVKQELSSLEHLVDEYTGRLAGLSKVVEDLGSRLNALAEKVTSIETRVETLESRLEACCAAGRVGGAGYPSSSGSPGWQTGSAGGPSAGAGGGAAASRTITVTRTVTTTVTKYVRVVETAAPSSCAASATTVTRWWTKTVTLNSVIVPDKAALVLALYSLGAALFTLAVVLSRRRRVEEGGEEEEEL